MPKLKTDKIKVIAASLAVAGIPGASIAVVSSASGAPSPSVSALTAGSAATLPAPVANQLRSGDPAARGADPANARAVTTSAGRWYLAPTKDGACLVTEDFTVTCGSMASVDDGTLASIELSGGTGEGEQLRPAGLATIRGVAVDGFTVAQVLDKAGAVVTSGAVAHNTYAVKVPALNIGAAIRLMSASGKSQTIALMGPPS